MFDKQLHQIYNITKVLMTVHKAVYREALIVFRPRVVYFVKTGYNVKGRIGS